MNIDPFIAYLNAFTPLSSSAISAIANVAERKIFPKKHILITDLAACRHLYFIEKGLVRAYFYHNGKEVTDWFGIENTIVGPAIRNFPVKNTVHQVELLEESIVVSVSFADLEKLFGQFHDIERLGRLIAVQTIVQLQHKIDILQLLSAKSRYEDFITRYPTLLNRVPLGYISSYLGMNQVTLSRIRKG
ncbi:MAG: Crp/Fnr family transcriptional regulator [Chitinophagales bacterium]|nr:Crp/Fnr family transcriptional regulator [Chitinophagales bacterium]